MTRLSIRRALSAATVVVAAAGLVVAAAPSPASAAGTRGAAFVWSYFASPEIGDWYTPWGSYQYNSTSPDALVNTVQRIGPGEYYVMIPGLLGFGATHSTAYGGDAAYCNSGVTESPDGALVHVLCFNAQGQPTDHMFTLSFTNVREPQPGTAIAYMEVEDDGAVWDSRHYNSAGPKSTVSRMGAYYVVRIPGLGAFGGHVQVSSADRGSRCKVAGWGPSGYDELVYVICWFRGSFNLPADAPFILTYVDQQNILGQPVAPPAGHESAYAWANEPTSPEYLTHPFYKYASTGHGWATGTRTDVGVYGMSFDDANLDNGNVQVTAYGSGQEFCNVAYWYGSSIQVRCFDWDGTPVDTFYTLAFTGSLVAG